MLERTAGSLLCLQRSIEYIEIGGFIQSASVLWMELRAEWCFGSLALALQLGSAVSCTAGQLALLRQDLCRPGTCHSRVQGQPPLQGLGISHTYVWLRHCRRKTAVVDMQLCDVAIV